MKQDHRPWDIKTFEKGANTDQEQEGVARTPGNYHMAQNMRLVDNGGGNGALVKIPGEEVQWESVIPGANTYVCIGTHQVKEHAVEFWASTSPALYFPLIRIDGVIMAQSADIPYVWDKKLQLHSAWECGGGKIFDARSGAVPIHWDIGHIIEEFNAGNQTYRWLRCSSGTVPLRYPLCQ
jgi:hypothetical protein